MNKFIVTTTINSPTKAILKFADKKDWKLVVVGDLRTPHREYLKLSPKCVYLHPIEQAKAYPELSKLIGFNTVDRRNFGFLYAIDCGADVIATVDDDNIPYDDWGEDLYIDKEIDVDCYSPKAGIFDPLSVTNRPELWHRGYPIDLLKYKNINTKTTIKCRVDVQADLWDGSPDIDAIQRITYGGYDVTFNITKPFCSNCISPFNSQNTFLSKRIMPYYMCLPHVGRMDDIWGSYLLQQLKPHIKIIYNRASVFQERNEHELTDDLSNELLGYKETLNFIDGRYTLSPHIMDAYILYSNTISQLLFKNIPQI